MTSKGMLNWFGGSQRKTETNGERLEKYLLVYPEINWGRLRYEIKSFAYFGTTAGSYKSIQKFICAEVLCFRLTI